MARIFFLAFDSAGQTTLVKKLRAAGHKVAVAQPRYPEFYEMLKQQHPPPDVIVADCSTTPSHAREACNYIQGLPAHRTTPLLLYNVKKEDEPKAREKVPRALLVSGDKIEPHLVRLVASPPATSTGVDKRSV